MRISDLPAWAESVLATPPATAARCRLRETKSKARRAMEVDVPLPTGALDRVRDWLEAVPGDAGEVRIDWYDGSGTPVRGGRSATVHDTPPEAVDVDEDGDEGRAAYAEPPPRPSPPSSATRRPVDAVSTRSTGEVAEAGPVDIKTVRSKVFHEAVNSGNMLLALYVAELEQARLDRAAERQAHADELRALLADRAAERAEAAAERRELLGVLKDAHGVQRDTVKTLTSGVNESTKVVRDMVAESQDLTGELLKVTLQAREAAATARADAAIATHRAEVGAPAKEDSPTDEIKAWIGLLKEAGGVIGDLRGTEKAKPIFKALHSAYVAGNKAPLIEWVTKTASKEDIEKLGAILADPALVAALGARAAAA